MRVLGLALLALAVAGCGGDDNYPTYSIGGTIAGLATGASVTLSINGTDALTVYANGPFVFPTRLKRGASYLVAVATLPTGEQCGVTGASGSVAGSVTSVQLTCAVPTLQLVAGALGGSGNVDGDRTTARFHSPQDVVPDAAGNLYSSVDIPGRHRWGRALLHACQSVCRCDRQLATFTAPFALALDSENNLFITDGNAIRKLSAAGIVSTVAGSQGPGSSDGSRSAAHFNGPAGIAVGPAGSLFIADTKNHTIRKISSDGIVTTIAGSAEKFGVTLGPLPTTLNAPFGLTYIGSTLYVTDAAENSLLAITSQF